MIAAVIFDMDGVLVDSEPLHFATTNQVLARFGVALDAASYDSYRGMAETPFFEALVARFCLPARPDALAQARVAASLERMASGTLLPMPGALPCLLGLSSEGFSLGLASSSRRVQVDLVVARLGLRRLLRAVVSVDEVARGKPEPDLFLEAARRLGHAPGECLVVEDAVYGVQAAVTAGMRVVALPPAGDAGEAHRAAGALACLGSLAELDADFVAGVETSSAG